MMSIIDQLEHQNGEETTLVQGGIARVKHTGQIVNLKRVSDHGISVVSFRTGGDYFISNKFLEPVIVLH